MNQFQRGAALIEFALGLPVLMLLLVGLIEYGRYAYFAIEIANAAHAGALYGSQNSSTANDTSGMKNATIDDGQNAITPLTLSSVTAQAVCTCWTGSSQTPSPPNGSVCGQPCASGRNITYAQVTVTASMTPLFNYSALGAPASWSVTRTATIRVLQ